MIQGPYTPTGWAIPQWIHDSLARGEAITGSLPLTPEQKPVQYAHVMTPDGWQYKPLSEILKGEK